MCATDSKTDAPLIRLFLVVQLHRVALGPMTVGNQKLDSAAAGTSLLGSGSPTYVVEAPPSPRDPAVSCCRIRGAPHRCHKEERPRCHHHCTGFARRDLRRWQSRGRMGGGGRVAARPWSPPVSRSPRRPVPSNRSPHIST
jgi:hypothetical protein